MEHGRRLSGKPAFGKARPVIVAATNVLDGGKTRGLATFPLVMFALLALSRIVLKGCDGLVDDVMLCYMHGKLHEITIV